MIDSQNPWNKEVLKQTCDIPLRTLEIILALYSTLDVASQTCHIKFEYLKKKLGMKDVNVSK